MIFQDFIQDISESYEALRKELFEMLMNSECEDGIELKEIGEVWKNRPFDGTETNYEHYKPLIENLSKEDALKLFLYTCVEEMPFPDCLVRIIVSDYPEETGKILKDALPDEVLLMSWTHPDEGADSKINSYSAALEYFQKFFPDEACAFALERFETCPSVNDALLENFSNAIVSVTDENTLVSMIRNESQEAHKQALMYGICSSMKRSDALFMLLKTEFKKAPFEEKMDYGYVLSAYGDGRAVTVLRKYALELQEQWIMAPAEEKEALFARFSEARELVEDLGGSMET